MPEHKRNLIGFLGLAVAIVAAIVVLALQPEPVPGPATGAAGLIPRDALLYVHVSTDRSRPVVRQALAVGARFPDFALAEGFVADRLAGILHGGPTRLLPDVATQVLPWVGREAAFALLNTATSTAGSVFVLGVRRRSEAVTFLDGQGAAPAGSYHGTPLLRFPSGTMLAFVRHYLVVGQSASVQAAIDAAHGRVRSLSASSQYAHAAAGEPGSRVLDVYLSADGVRRVLAAQGGLLGALGVLLYQPALTGTTLAVSPSAAGLKVRVHGALDRTLLRVSGPPPRGFSPTLASTMPAGTTLLLEVSGLARAAPRVLGAGAEGGIAGQVGPLLHRLGTALGAEGVDVGQITSLFSGETAVAVSPATATKTGSAGRGPALVIVARTAHEDATRRLLASLEAPLAELFPPPRSGPGQAPEFSTIPVSGINVHQLRLAPGLQLDYAVFGGLVAVSTSLEAIGLMARHAHSLADEPGYRATVGAGPSGVTSLVFLNFSQLLSLAEQTGLARSARVAALRADLDKLQAIGLESTRGETDTTAELTLSIS